MTGTLDILDRLIAFDTVSAKSNLPLIVYVQDFLTSRGFRVTRIDDPAEPKAGLYAEIGPEGAGVLLSGHSDVVPVDGQTWTRDPFRLSRAGNRLYGRGTTDMKGFVASMLNVADRASRTTLREPLKLVLSYDEEVGCVGIARMMKDLAPRLSAPRMAVVGEPTGMQVATGHKGKRAFRARVTGEAGHSSLAPQFVNALNVAAVFVQALQGIQADLVKHGARDGDFDVPFSTVHVGVLTGGRALNIVPEEAEMTFELRHLPTDSPDALEERIRTAAERVSARYGTAGRIEIETLTAYPGLDTRADAPVVAAALDFAQSRAIKVAFGTEAGFFAAQEIPTVVCGPGDMAGQGHKADEYLTQEQLQACDAMLGRVLGSIMA